MEVIELLNSPELAGIVSDLRKVREVQKANAWNIFNLSSYNNQLENFHSDVIASLLDPEGLHGEGNKFLLLFIEYLVEKSNLKIDIDNYTNARVVREESRLDIWIKGNGHCIIIENKINNAPDGDEQILTYYNRASRTHRVNAIVYLSLDGLKKAPLSTDEVNSVSRNIPAFCNQDVDIVHGWLLPCIKNAISDNSSTLIAQYVKLLKQLNNRAMEQSVNEQFYRFVSDSRNMTVLQNAIELLEKLNTYRRDKFIKTFHNSSPFDRISKLQNYGDCGVVFEHFNVNGEKLKMDVSFETHEAWIRIWTSLNDNEIGLAKVQQTLSKIGLLDDFQLEHPNLSSSMMRKRFLVAQYGNMISVDDAVKNYVNEIIGKLKEM